MPEQGIETTRPKIRITGLHIRGLKSIKALDLPADGIDWQGRIPDTVVIGGANGTGKTTLLEFLYTGLRTLEGNPRPLVSLLDSIVGGSTPERTNESRGAPDLSQLAQALIALMPNAWVDFDVTCGPLVNQRLRLLVGTQDFIAANKTENCFGLGPGFLLEGPAIQELLSIQVALRGGVATDIPAVIYLPSRRGLVLPEVQYKRAGKLAIPRELVYCWERPTEWDESIEALLYAARWADLNAKDRGQPEKANHFAAYASAFETFYEGTKWLEWTTEGELVVRIHGGEARHGLAGLSDGEKQVIVLSAELLLRWRPGSLILIDEPELHLHTHWQAKLMEMLQRFQQQRGGQVILATQSGDLFGFAPEHSCVLLGGHR